MTCFTSTEMSPTIRTSNDSCPTRPRHERGECVQSRFARPFAGVLARCAHASRQAALGVAQLEHLDEALARKRAIGARYTNGLQGCPGLQLPPDASPRGDANCYWVYAVLCTEEDAEAVMKRLADLKVLRRGAWYCARFHIADSCRLLQ